VHCSLRSFGYVVGGVQSLYLSLRERLGIGGTIVVPSFTPQLHHPSTWRTPDLVAGAHRVLDAVPAFNPRLTPAAREMGVLSETVRALPASRRSGHPHVSFVAEGLRATQVTSRHALAHRFSDTSPLGALWDLDASVLMLGTGWTTCAALHLAEYAAAYPGRRVGRWPVPQSGPAFGAKPTRWLDVPELLAWDGDFAALGAAYERTGGPLRSGVIGDATCRLVPLRPLLRFAAAYFLAHRDLRHLSAPPGWLDLTEHPEPLPAPEFGPLPLREARRYPPTTTPARSLAG
jgi:aminoglycoside 3-N-acetyltransferase